MMTHSNRLFDLKSKLHGEGTGRSKEVRLSAARVGDLPLQESRLEISIVRPIALAPIS